MIRTGSINEMLEGQFIGELVIIVAGSGIPRNRYQHLLDVGEDIRHMARFAPSKYVLSEYKKGGSELRYTRDFIKYMEDGNKFEELKDIVLDSEMPVRLVCHEPEDGSFCHRHILKSEVEYLLLRESIEIDRENIRGRVNKSRNR